jgi:hypothetical protein
MIEDNRRYANGNHLPDNHHDRKDNGPKFSNGIKDAQLARSGSNGSNDIVLKCLWIGQQKFPHYGKVARKQESRSGKDNGRSVDAQHHLIWIYIGSSIFGINFVLPLGCKGIESNVKEKVDETSSCRFSLLIGSFHGQ